ncbi:MAG: SurA N-terminal domain-containing protein [Magnetococcales bacterium]|nr:SurA N-terminal domain-containing protein [Magnetococcales bacterium]
MLSVMRRGAKSWVIKVRLVLISLSFVVWGVGDDLGQGSRKPLVEANNWTITSREFSEAYENEFQRMRQQFGNSLDKKMADAMGLKQRSLSSLINYHLIQDAGRSMNLTISPAQLQKTIAENPAFQTLGNFDNNRYNLLLRNNQITPKEYEYKLSADMLSSQIQQSIGTFSVTPEIIVKDSYNLAGETRKIITMSLDPKKLEKDINPDDATLQAYLDKHIDRYMTPAKVKVRHILLNSDSVVSSISVTDEQLQEYYYENTDQYTQAETREARHILVKIDEKVDDAAALKKIQQAAKRLKDGEDFANVAKDTSEDVSASQGGSLGQFARGMMVKPFDDVAFSLNIGIISEPVKTQFGYHLIKVDKINPAKSKSYEEVKNQIEPIVINQIAVNKVYDLSITLENQLYASGDMQGVSKDLNLRYRETDFFSQQDANKLKGIEKEPKFQEIAFSTSKGDISSIIELPNNRFFALEVMDRQEPRPKELAETKTSLLSDYRKVNAELQAKELMEATIDNLAKGESWESLAKSNKLFKISTSNHFKRDDKSNKPASAIRAAAFKLTLAKPDYNQAIRAVDGFTLVRLQDIKPANQDEFEKEAQEIRNSLQISLGMEQLTAFVDGLWKKANIRINQELFNQI